MSGILGMAVIHGALAANPVRDVGKIEAEPVKPAQALDPEQLLDWLIKIDEDEFAIRWDLPDLSRFLVATGDRIGEALSVGWENVRWDASEVVIGWHLVYVKGVGIVREPYRKGGRARRKGHAAKGLVLTLPNWGMDMLRRRWEAMGCPAEGPVFPDSLGGWRDPSNVRRALRTVREKAGYEWLTSHSLGRKTVTTVLDEAGVSARKIADQLGQSQVSITQHRYMKRRSANTEQAAVLERELAV